MLNFTQCDLDITKLLKREEENEIVIRVGAHIGNGSDTVATAGEVEKQKYYAGIYDDALCKQQPWNHASVCLWDAQNETWSPATAEAINMVREYDHSNRPWDNGWSPPAGKNDYREAHNYYFSSPEPFKLSDLKHRDKFGRTFYAPYQAFYNKGEFNEYWDYPCVLNEYAYLWLNRDGTPTTLAKPYFAGDFELSAELHIRGEELVVSYRDICFTDLRSSGY